MGTMSPAATANPTHAVNAMGRCQVCGQTRSITPAKFDRNIGMLVLRQTRSIQGNMCKSCLGNKFWEYTGLNLLLGPWGMISLVVTPIYLITNVVMYFSASRRLSGAVE